MTAARINSSGKGIAAVVAIALIAAAQSAEAGGRIRVHKNPQGVVAPAVRCPGSVWVPPVYRTVERIIEEPAVYETVTRKVWREPIFEIRDVLVEIPAEVATVKVPRYGSCGTIIGYDYVQQVIKPARKVWQKQKICIREGFYETVCEQVLVKPACRKVVTEQVLVREGYWAQSCGTPCGHSGGVVHVGGTVHAGATIHGGPMHATGFRGQASGGLIRVGARTRR